MALSEETSIRLIGGGGTRGLSGDLDRVLPADPALDFFNACLRRHVAAGDMVRDPDQLWQAQGNPARLGGLGPHLASVSRERLVGLSDVLVVINGEDWQRAAREVGVGWGREVVLTLQARIQDERARLGLAGDTREVGVRLLADGSGPMQGELIGLEPGEFVTGVLPNQHDGPAAGARALVAVHLNLPGVWSGYREVARLHADQDLLTLGSHWLDNYAHPALAAPAIYRLQYTPGEGLVHLVSPDTAGRFRLQHHAEPGGPSVYALQKADGEAIAWLVLAVIDDAAAPAPAPAPAPVPGPTPSLVGRTFHEDPSAAVVVVEESPTVDPLGHPGDPLLAQPTFDPLDTASGAHPAAAPPAPAPAPSAPSPTTTAAVELDDQLVTLREQGVLLQRVHFRDIMRGYEVYIGAGGEISTAAAAPAATLRVEGTTVRLIARQLGVRIGGIPVPPAAAAVLGGEAEIFVGAHRFLWRDLRQVRVRGWPYLGEIRRRAGSTHLVGGMVHTIGRGSTARVRLPDDSHNGNILWRPEADAGQVIRAKNGEVPKSRFTLDSIMVAAEHLELDLGGGAPRVRSVARHCYSFIRRDTPAGQRIISLSRAQRPTGETEAVLEPGDDLLVGNCVFEVDWAAPASDPTALPVGKPPPVVFSDGEDELAAHCTAPGAELPPTGFDLPPPPPLVPDDPTGLPTGAPPPVLLDDGAEDDSMVFYPVPTRGWQPSLDAVSGAEADPTAPPEGAPPPPVHRAGDAPADDSLDGDWAPGQTLDPAGLVDEDDSAEADPTALPGEGPPPPLRFD